MKKQLAFALALVMIMTLTACSNNKENTTEVPKTTVPSSEQSTTQAQTTEAVPEVPREYIYKDAVRRLSANWNPHTFRTAEDSYPLQYLSGGLYTFIPADSAHTTDGVEYHGAYAVLPEMAAAMPEDVTVEVRSAHPEFGIPENAESGYAFRIALNPQAVWQDGTPINADTYVDSMQRLLDPKLMNYRASDYYEGSLCLAGAKAYALGGSDKTMTNSPDGETLAYKLDDLQKGADGVYQTAEGYVCSIGLDDTSYGWLGGNSLRDYYNFGYIPEDVWKAMEAKADGSAYVPFTDEIKTVFGSFIAGDDWGGETEEEIAYYLSYRFGWPEKDFSTVGIMKSGDHEITLVLERPLSQFYLLQALSRNWIVNTEVYDAALSEKDGTYTSSYGTSPESSPSCGPYVLTAYQQDASMHFERNEKWYGWTDGRHSYTDPEDGQTYPMYETTAIDVKAVDDAAEREALFAKGELMSLTLQADALKQYADGKYPEGTFYVPGSAVYFLILNGSIDAASEREAAQDFDKAKTDLQTLTLKNFREAVAASCDAAALAADYSPLARDAMGLIGQGYIADPETAMNYRSTDQAKKALCEHYGIDPEGAASLDDALALVKAYDPERAKVFFTDAYTEALERKYITDENGDGISDQTVRIEYALAAESDIVSHLIESLNSSLGAAAAGTPFEGKIEVVQSAPYGQNWVNAIKTGKADAVLASWNGTATDPFSLTALYTDPAKQYDANWFNAEETSLTLNVQEEEVTLSLKQWSDALNGAAVRADGKTYCFGSGAADTDTRLYILAAVEKALLDTFDYLPLLEDAAVVQLSQQVRYPFGGYDAVTGRSGIAFLRYLYSEAEWEAYVASQGGEIKY